MLGPVGLGRARVEELEAAPGQLGQPGLRGGRGGRGRGLEDPAVVAQDRGVEGVGLGAQALGAGEVAHAPGFDHADGNLRGLEGADHGLFVAAGGLADDVRAGPRAQELAQPGVALGVVGEGVGLAGQVELQGSLGHVEADVQDGGVVLTHTCSDTSRAGCRPARSGNGSSSEQ